MNTNLTTCFAVTDQHIVIPLKVISQEDIEDFTKVVTEIVGEVDGHKECHHQHYFETMWLDDNGLPDKGNVFVDEEQAYTYALKKSNEELDIKRGQMATIERTVAEIKNCLP